MFKNNEFSNWSHYSKIHEAAWLDLNANECKRGPNMNSSKMSMFGWRKSVYQKKKFAYGRYMHKRPEVEERSSNFARKIHRYLWNNFPRAMEGLESKRKRLNIDDGEGRLVDQSPFTSFALTRNYGVNIHVDVDDADICFILWIHEEDGMGANGGATFCLPEFEVKFETRNGAIFMFRADKVLHSTMKNQRGNQYGMAFFQKNSVLNHLKSLKR
ncbi:hypothetical protein CY35_02G000100 [Sphagnum magellanicum]|nr:hypothetical protein CY35_02G000100 [Sphagnum magellanicum]